MILDSGERREFKSGAVRDITEGKGRCDLLPLDIVAGLLEKHYREDFSVLRILSLIRKENADLESVILLAVNTFCQEQGVSAIKCVLDVSKHFEEGAKKYEERNWEKGIDCHCFLDSGIRHYLKFRDGWIDEPHDRAFLWNMLCLLWTIKNHPNLVDIGVSNDSE